jgi:3-oxoacyl-[acyl-carrier-protein] synthase-3
MSAGQVYLAGWAAHHPEGRLTNDDLVTSLDTTHEWLESRIGILERRIAADDETVAAMGAASVRGAAAGAGLDVGAIDLVISASSFDDHDMPASAARIAALLDSDAFTFDVRAACSGWLVGVEVAAAFLETGRASHVAVCATEKTSLSIDPTDRGTRPFFGDAAGATIVQSERPAQGLEVIDIRRWADNSAHDAVLIPNRGWFQMDGPRTRTWVEGAIAEVAKGLLDDHGLVAADLRGLVCHQANLRLIERVATDLGVPPERHWHNVEWAGNTSAAGAPTSLAAGLDANRADLRPGDPILVVTVGAGLNVVGSLLRWVSD